MVRFLSVAAVAAAALSLAPAATAQTARGYYAATPLAAPAKSNVVTRTTVWKCGEGVCTASKATSRDAIMCELVAGEVGKLSAFRANGQEFDAASLEKCNARAR